MSFLRGREHHSDKRIVIPDAKLGAGAIGDVYRIIQRSTDETKGCPVIHKASGRRYVAKCIYAKNGQTPEELRQVALQEYAAYKKAAHLHVKELVEHEGKFYIIMDEVPGVQLFNIIKAIWDKLSALQSIRLGIAIVEAVQKQVHDLGLIHCDIKPENIMVDLSDKDNPKVNVIDFGLARDKSIKFDGVPMGTVDYAAPELLYREDFGSERTDAYSLGIVLACLYCKESKYPIGTNSFEVESPAQAVGSRFYTARPGYINIKNELQNLLVGMCNDDPAARTTLRNAYIQLNKIKRHLKYGDLSEKKQKAMAAAHASARTILRSPNIDQSIDQIKTTFSKIKIDNVAIGEFIETLGLKAFRGCRSTGDMTITIGLIEKSYLNACETLKNIEKNFQAFQDLYKHTKLLKKEKLGDAVAHYQAIVMRKLEKHAGGKFKSLDDFEAATASMNRAIKEMPTKMEMLIEKRCERVFSRTSSRQTQDDLVRVMTLLQDRAKPDGDKLQKLRCFIRRGISTYLYKTASKANLFFGCRAASQRRLKDMREILAIVNDGEITSKNDMERKIQNRMKAMQFGLFGCDNSKLYKEVTESFKKAAAIGP